MDINLAIWHNGSHAPGKHPQHFLSSNFCDDCSGSCHLKDEIKSNEHPASGGDW